MAVLQPEERASLDTLFAALAQTFEGEHRPGGDAAAAALRTAQRQPFRQVQATTQPTSLLEDTCVHQDALPVAASIMACRRFISWTNWAGEGLTAALSSRLHTAELLGPDGHVDHGHVRVGLLLSEMATDYPISRHSGEETYLVISGVAEWSVGGAPYIRHAPGTLVHHPAWAPHGRRSLTEPFLGAWRWSGDLDLSTFKVDEV